MTRKRKSEFYRCRSSRSPNEPLQASVYGRFDESKRSGETCAGGCARCALNEMRLELLQISPLIRLMQVAMSGATWTVLIRY